MSATQATEAKAGRESRIEELIARDPLPLLGLERP